VSERGIKGQLGNCIFRFGTSGKECFVSVCFLFVSFELLVKCVWGLGIRSCDAMSTIQHFDVNTGLFSLRPVSLTYNAFFSKHREDEDKEDKLLSRYFSHVI
jgi:hypothetical protein